MRVSRSDPAATASQKKLVALVLSEPPAGIAKALSRHFSSDHVTGSDHCLLAFGPVGPL